MIENASKTALFRQRFIQRDDCYPVQYANNSGSYTVIREKLTDGVLLDHLKGNKTIGLYGSSDSNTKWLCIDIDDRDEIAVREVQNHIQRFTIPYLTEFSGNKGYHVWIFFDNLYPNRIARALAGAFTFYNEVFPKQDIIGTGKLGNLVKAPLGKHQVTGNWCLFLDKDLRPEKDQYGVLAGIQLINPIHVICKSLPEIWHKLMAKPHNENNFNPVKLPIIKDCVKVALFQGAEQGKRNRIGHIIATEFRNAGLDKNKTDSVLKTIWNPKNQPPLSEDEISLIVNSAYESGGYVYGCKEGSPLKKYLTCVGLDNCLFMAILRRGNC